MRLHESGKMSNQTNHIVVNTILEYGLVQTFDVKSDHHIEYIQTVAEWGDDFIFMRYKPKVVVNVER